MLRGRWYCREMDQLWNGREIGRGSWCDQKKLRHPGTSLLVQWLRICLLMQGTWFDSCSRKLPLSTEQLSPWATTTEVLTSQQEKPPQWEPQAPQLERSPCLLQLEKSLNTATKTHCSKKKRMVKLQDRAERDWPARVEKHFPSWANERKDAAKKIFFLIKQREKWLPNKTLRRGN